LEAIFVLPENHIPDPFHTKKSCASWLSLFLRDNPLPDILKVMKLRYAAIFILPINHIPDPLKNSAISIG
jgi:hypothetical protein